MRLIGLTGGIATGKTTVAGLLAARGAEVVDADLLAREVVVRGAPALGEIAAEFGAEVIDREGSLDRDMLGRLVFADEVARRRLEGITHPRITALMADRLAEALAGPATLVLADIPLLFESHRQSMFEGTLLVYAPATVQVARMVERDGLDEASARSRLGAQLPIADKLALATWVIDNSGSLEDTAAAVSRWWDEVATARS